MTRGGSGLILALALVLSIDDTAQASDEIPAVHVEIVDDSHAGWTLVAALPEVRKIYELADIRLVMIVTSSPQPRRPDAVQVVVLSGRVADRMRPDRLPRTVLGYARIAE